MYEGVISFIKPQGITSHDLVSIVRRKLKMKRVGHTGTLDPMATGVLPICVGKGTKIVEFLVNDKKVYRAELTLGAETDTQDMWGTVVNSSDKIVSEEEIRLVMKKFIGDISQIPPMYSALKHKGKKLYELAREGITVEREARIRTIYSIDVISINGNKVLFDVCCSKGTYIRTLCHDIGIELGTFGHMSFLERTATGEFNFSNSITIEDFDNMDIADVEKKIIPVDVALGYLKKLHFSTSIKDKVLNGVKINFLDYLDEAFDGNLLANEEYILLYCEKIFYGIGIYKENSGIIVMDKLFYTGDNNENI